MTGTYFATKYDSAADEVIAILSDVNEGYGKESTGDVESPVGYISLVILDDTCDLDVQDTTGAYPRGDLAGETAREYGVTAEDIRGNFIVVGNSQGFIGVERFDTAEAAQAEFDCREARYAAWSEQEEDDPLHEGDGVYVCPVIGHGYHSV